MTSDRSRRRGRRSGAAPGSCHNLPRQLRNHRSIANRIGQVRRRLPAQRAAVVYSAASKVEGTAAGGYSMTPSPTNRRVDRRTVDLSAYPDLVVIYLGMRVNVLA